MMLVYRGGLGDAASTTQTAGAAANAALTAATAGAFGSSAAASATALIPIVGPIIAGVTLGLTALFSRKGPKQKEAATKIVDDLEPLLAANRDAYLSEPRTMERQRVALENFDRAWAGLVETLSQPELGNPGRAGISDRDRGGKHDWFALYRDPIEQAVPPDPDSRVLAMFSPGAESAPPASLLLPAAIALIAVGVLS